MRAIPIILLVLLLAGNARGELADALAGYWRGSLLATGGDTVAEKPVDVRLDATRRGFEIAVTAPGTAPFKATMVPAEAPDVFEEAAAGSLFSFLDASDDRSVLDGRPLLWARRTAEGIIAYRLQIVADGDSELLRIVIMPSADGLEVSLERRLNGVAEPDLHGVLERRS